MTHPNYERIYEIIKEQGPISLAEIGRFLPEKCTFRHSEVAGYISNLSKNGLIKNVARETQEIRKTSPKKIWLAVEKLKEQGNIHR